MIGRRLWPIVAAVLVLAACAPDSATTSTGVMSFAPNANDPLAPFPKGQMVSNMVVTKVVDGDTIDVKAGEQTVRVRMIGIDAPESVRPGSPVECFGPDAAKYAQLVLEGTPVTLEYDASQGPGDEYGRILAYVWRQLPGGTLSMFNLEALQGGFVRERQYSDVPYAWKTEFSDAEAQAKADAAGLWGAC